MKCQGVDDHMIDHEKLTKRMVTLRGTEAFWCVYDVDWDGDEGRV